MSSDIKYRSKAKRNVATVCKCMGWPKPTYTDSSTNGYICKWGIGPFVKQFGIRYSYQAISKIYQETGINCTLTSSGNLVIPYCKED